MTTTFTVLIDWDHNGTWSDESSRTQRVQARTGFDQPGDYVAGVGRCTLTLANDDGRFSPDNVRGPLYGKLLPRRPVLVRATDGSTTWTLFRGFIEHIAPTAGRYEPQIATITCVDGIALLDQQRISVAHAATKPVDEALAALVAATYTPPASLIFANGDTLSHYGEHWQPEHTTALDAIHDICRAVYGRFFVQRDGTVSYWSRREWQSPGAYSAVLDTGGYHDLLRRTRPANLLACWPLWESAGTVAGDYAGQGRDGAAAGITWGAEGIGDGHTAAGLAGAAWIDLDGTDLASAFDGGEGTLLIWLRAASGLWTDGAAHTVMRLAADADNALDLRKSTTDNQLTARYRAGGTLRSIDRNGLSTTGWLCCAVTWSALDDALRLYVDGSPVGSAQTGLGSWAGALATALIGAADDSGSEGWSGSLAHAALWDVALGADEIAALASAFAPIALDGLAVRLDIASVINRAQVTVYPLEEVDTEAEIWRARTVLRLPPGETRIIYANFRDEHGARCGAVDVVAPVATTDYTVNDRPDGSGFDYTQAASFSISATTEATRMQIALTNDAIGPLYVTLLRVRGKPIITYDPITLEAADSASQSAYQVRARALDLPLQADPTFAETMAGYLVQRHKAPALTASQVTCHNRETLRGTNVFAFDLMDQVVVSDPASGASGLLHWIRALDYDLGPASFRAVFHLERADDTRYWLLGQPNYGELGSTTRLAL